MAVQFATHTPAVGRHAGKPRLYVSISTGPDDKQAIHREATDADAVAYPAEFAAFQAPAVAEAALASLTLTPAEAVLAAAPEETPAVEPESAPVVAADEEKAPKKSFFRKQK